MWQNKENKKPEFDRSILMTIGITSVIGLFIMGYKLITYSDCSGTDFMIAEGSLVAGQIVSFKDQTPGAGEWEWNFGDGSAPVMDEEPLHIFKHPGKYRITLQVDGGCTARKEVTIRESEALVNSSQYPTFSMPSTARVGEVITVTDNTEGAEEWQWSFGESMQVDATTKNPTYIFQSSGVKTVALIVNGNERYTTKKRITVFAKPVEKPEFDLAPPEKAELKQEVPDDTVSISEVPLAPPLQPIRESRAPEISRIGMEDYLLQIAGRKREPESLQSFCCDGYDTRVRANGEEIVLQLLLQEIQGKKIDIENLDIIRHKETGCIDFIKIDYNRKKVLGIF